MHQKKAAPKGGWMELAVVRDQNLWVYFTYMKRPMSKPP